MVAIPTVRTKTEIQPSAENYKEYFGSITWAAKGIEERSL